MLYYYVYVSSSINDFTDADLQELLCLARKRNHENGITGMLLYVEGNFMQVLEGEKSAVLMTLGRIELDSRHHNIYKVLDGEEAVRQFPDWSMAYMTTNPEELAASLPGYSDYLHTHLTEPCFWNSFGPCHKLIRQFKQNNVFL